MSSFFPKNLRSIEFFEQHRQKDRCPKCFSNKNVVRRGRFFTKANPQGLQRFRCNACKQGFSEKTLAYNKYEKKPLLMAYIYRYLAAGISQREIARLMSVRRKTVDLNLIKIAAAAKVVNDFILSFFPEIDRVCFDDGIRNCNRHFLAA